MYRRKANSNLEGSHNSPTDASPADRPDSDPDRSGDSSAATESVLAEIRLRLDQKEGELRELKRRLAATKTVLIQKENELNRIMGTLGWRLLSRYGPLKHRYLLPMYIRLRRLLGKAASSPRGYLPHPEPGEVADSDEDSYQDWAARCERLS